MERATQLTLDFFKGKVRGKKRFLSLIPSSANVTQKRIENSIFNAIEGYMLSFQVGKHHSF